MRRTGTIMRGHGHCTVDGTRYGLSDLPILVDNGPGRDTSLKVTGDGHYFLSVCESNPLRITVVPLGRDEAAAWCRRAARGILEDPEWHKANDPLCYRELFGPGGLLEGADRAAPAGNTSPTL